MAEVSPGGGATNKRKRKRDDVAARLKRRKAISISVVKCTLNQALTPQARAILKPKLEDAARQVTQATYEASKLLALHIQRLCESRQPMGIMNQSFFNRLVCSVSTSRGALTTPDDQHLAESVEQYRALRDGVTECPYATRDGITRTFNYAGKEMMTNASNHVLTNFYKFTQRWIRCKVDALGLVFGVAAERHKLVDKIYKCINDGADVATIAAHPALPQLVHAARGRLDGLLPATDATLQKKWASYLPWFHVVVGELEATGDGDENEHWNRLFTVTPHSAMRAQYATLDTAALRDMLSTTKTAAQRKAKAEGKPHADVGTGIKGMETVPSMTAFLANRRDPWSLVFDLPRFETERRKFEFTMKTDGTSACMTMAVDGLRKSDVAPWREAMTIDEKTRVVGVDPGRRDLFVAVDRHENVVKCSNREFWDLAGYKRRLHQMKVWQSKAHPHVRDMLACPSPKTASRANLEVHIEFVLARLEANLTFHCARRVRALAFTTYQKKQKAFDEIVNRLVGGSKDAVIAFGDAKFSSASKGSAPGPVKAMRSALRRSGKCRLVAVDEYLTSQVCSKEGCGTRNLKGPAPELLVAERRGGNTEMRFRRRPIHGVRVCQDCRMTWNRDVNAARNILCAFLHINAHDGARPANLARPVARSVARPTVDARRCPRGGAEPRLRE